ncbi:MAG: arginase [Armatimonadetes bacterium]|nr:arginase [Armatimonadota bacterium]
MVECLAVPFDFCGPHHGSRLGALAMELAGLPGSLARIGVQSVSHPIVEVDGRLPGLRRDCDQEALNVYSLTRDRVAESIERGNTPLVIGGDHSISIGSISGALKATEEGLAVLWVDAHMDVNTPDTTPSGNLHGVPLAVLTGLDAADPLESQDRREKPWIADMYELWPALASVLPRHRLRSDRLGWLGLRDVDPGEVRNAGRLPGCHLATMQDIDARGLLAVVEEVHKWLVSTGATHLWISFDVDVLDPVYAPGTGTAVRGGLSYREGHLLAETLASLFADPQTPYCLAGLDVVEVNPLRDHGNETAKVAVEWVCSLFGKTILNTLDPGRTERP